MNDALQRSEIFQARAKLIIAAVGAALMCALGGYIFGVSTGLIGSIAPPAGLFAWLGVLIGSVGIAFFGLGLIVAISRAFRRGPVLTFSSEGLHDRRLSQRPIPWAGIERVDTGSSLAGRRYIAVSVASAARDKAQITSLALIIAWLGARIRIPGLLINHADLRIGYRDLEQRIRTWFDATRERETHP